MKGGDIVTVSAPGDYGKPRLAVAIQSDGLDHTDSILLCLVTTEARDAPFFRGAVAPAPTNGLQRPPYIMVDKIVTVRRDRCGAAFGRLDQPTMLVFYRTLALVVGLAD